MFYPIGFPRMLLIGGGKSSSTENKNQTTKTVTETNTAISNSYNPSNSNNTILTGVQSADLATIMNGFGVFGAQALNLLGQNSISSLQTLAQTQVNLTHDFLAAGTGQLSASPASVDPSKQGNDISSTNWKPIVFGAAIGIAAIALMRRK